MKSILDASFRYTPSFETDLRKTFARIRGDDRTEAAPEFTESGHAALPGSTFERTMNPDSHVVRWAEASKPC